MALDSGIRQFLFILPPVAIFAASAYAMMASRLSKRHVGSAALHVVALAWVALVVRDMASIHPYEYVYFNQFALLKYHHPEATFGPREAGVGEAPLLLSVAASRELG